MFHPAVQSWFESTFNAATGVQTAAWAKISEGRNVLIAAPTGSGKTLAAFLCAINDLVVRDGAVVGAVGLDQATGEPVTIAAGAVVLAAGGLTKLYARNSASANMGGDAYALALMAGAELIDMEFPQFFPIGHLAPRLVHRSAVREQLRR